MTAAADRDDYVAFFEEDRTFHLEPVRLSGYEHLVAIVEQLRDRTLRYGIEDAIGRTPARYGGCSTSTGNSSST
jgi:DNA-binding GntR family transcriptional regulator